MVHNQSTSLVSLKSNASIKMSMEWSHLRKLNLVNKYRLLRQGWPNRSPKQKWQFLCDIPDVLLKIFGIRILGDCRVYWLSLFPSFLVFNYFGLGIYSLIYYGTRGRFLFGTRCLCGVGIVSTVMCFATTKSRYKLCCIVFAIATGLHIVRQVFITGSISIEKVISFFGRTYLQRCERRNTISSAVR